MRALLTPEKLDELAAAAKASGKRQPIVWDAEQPALGIKFNVASAAWYQRRADDNHFAIGKLSEIDLATARTMVRDALTDLRRKNVDPRKARDDAQRAIADERNAMTFGQFAELYVARKSKQTLRQKSFRAIERYLCEGDYCEPLRALRLKDITRKAVAACIHAIEEKRSAQVAKSTRRILSSMFRAAVLDGEMESNPVIDGYIPTIDNPSRERVFNDAELVTLWQGAGDDQLDKIIKLLLLTGCRRSEVGGMRWSEIDFDKALWTIPKARHKTGRKTNKPYIVPLVPEAIAIIRSIPVRAERDGLLFGSRSGHGFNFPKNIDDVIKLDGGAWGFHDTRRTVATRTPQLRIEHAGHKMRAIDNDTCEALLNHAKPSSVHSVHYDKSESIDLKRQALELWTADLMRIVGGNVVELKRAA